MCMPLGACLAFAGMEGTVPFLHGSQGCATYIRRYLISHFHEPMDIASSAFGESSTIFGGEPNLHEGVCNVTRVYRPQLIGVATTCLTETIGEDVPPMLRRIADPAAGPLARLIQQTGVRPPALVHAPTPSYAGTHADGFSAAVAAAVDTLAQPGDVTDTVAVLPGIVSTADLRHLGELLAAFGLRHTLMPDWSDRLDGPTVARYDRLPPGGTALADIVALGRSRAALSLGGLVSPGVARAGDLLERRFGVAHTRLPFPVGIRLTDAFVDTLAALAGTPDQPRRHPAWLTGERGRLVDAYVDSHKYVAQRRAVVYGDEDLVVGLAAFLSEIGVRPVVCATGGRSGRLAASLVDAAPELADRIAAGEVRVMEDTDFAEIEAAARQASPDLLVGHSKGYKVARALAVPLVRVGLPLHDRIGAQRVRHLGYRGAQELFDRVVNAVIEQRQDASPVGYSYM
ncbi:MAG: nitrogenase component 1 [Kineosporiaceae bacterium]